MYRFLFKPKWLGFHLLVVALIVLMVNLGIWQKHRLEDRREFNAEVRARSSEPIVPIEDVVTDATDPADVQWRTVTATGTYLADEQVVIVNRSQGGVIGVNVVTPLELDDGRLVLINRGFVPDSETVPAPTSGVVEVTGLAAVASVGPPGFQPLPELFHDPGIRIADLCVIGALEP